MLPIREVTHTAIALRLLLAILLGGMIGMERGLKNRPAGLRTYMLVCLGACMVMITNQYIYQAFGVGDPVRMAAQVISGIGFLGAGTIIVTARNQIKGLTTAAGLWASACVGLALGIGLYEVAVPGGIGIFIIMTLLQKLDFIMRHNAKLLEVYVELERDVHVGSFLEFVREHDLEPSNLQMQMENTSDLDAVAFSVTLKSTKNNNHDAIMRKIRSMEGLGYAEEL